MRYPLALALLFAIGINGLVWAQTPVSDAVPASSPPGDLGISPAIPPLIDDWLPSDWWTPEQFTDGYLNPDNYRDLAIIVARRRSAPEDPAFPRGSRALLVLYGMPDGRWRRGELVPGLLPCAECSNALGGNIGSAVFDAEITAEGLLELGWVERKRSIKAVRLSIGWDSAEWGLGLLRDEVSIVRPGKRSRVRRDYRAGLMWVDGVLQQMPARFIPIQEISADRF